MTEMLSNNTLGTMDIYQPNVVIKTVYLKDGKLEVIKREPSNQCYAVYRTDGRSTQVPDKVWKEIYGVKDGKIVLEQTIDAEVIPEKYTPEVLSFPTKENPV